ncbi:MAG TPA: helix-turn-helix transcriptional regulator [Thermodesulfobacteriota bacterium]
MPRRPDPRLVRVGRRIRVLREAAGLSQEKLSERAGLHRTYMSAVETGRRNASVLNLWRIADALKVSPAAFFEEDK